MCYILRLSILLRALNSFAIIVRRMKVSGEHFEDRIVEVHWDHAVEGWRMMRFRDDKPAGNHINTVESVIQSIRDGVEKEAVRTHTALMRLPWF